MAEVAATDSSSGLRGLGGSKRRSFPGAARSSGGFTPCFFFYFCDFPAGGHLSQLMAPSANSSQPEATPPCPLTRPTRLTRLKCFQSVSLHLEEPIVVLHILLQVTGQKRAEGQVVEC